MTVRVRCLGKRGGNSETIVKVVCSEYIANKAMTAAFILNSEDIHFDFFET